MSIQNCNCEGGITPPSLIPMVNVRARFLDQNGRPLAKVRVTMRLTTIERYCGLIVPRETSGYTDASGNVTLRVWPNELGTEGSEYQVTISYGDSCASPCGGAGASGNVTGLNRRFCVVVPNADCNLFDIVDLPPYEQRGSGQVITSEVAAFASQASSAADRAQSAIQSIECIRVSVEETGKAAEAAKDAALEAAKEAHCHEHHIKNAIGGLDEKICHFEHCIVERTEHTAQKLIRQATCCINQAEKNALDAIDARGGEVLSEISKTGSEIRQSAIESVNCAKENALHAICEAGNHLITDFREEAALFGEDFEALTERAEGAARRSGCSAASAANSATRACQCAERAENASKLLENYREDALDAAQRTETIKACLEADAQRAENAANRAQQNAEYAAGSAKAAQAAAKSANESASLAKQSADMAIAAQQAVATDRAFVESIKDDAGEALKELATDLLTDEIKEGAVAQATEDARRYAEEAAESAQASSASKDEATTEANKATENATKAEQEADRAEAAANGLDAIIANAEANLNQIAGNAEESLNGIIGEAAESAQSASESAGQAAQSAQEASGAVAQALEYVEAAKQDIQEHDLRDAKLAENLLRLANRLTRLEVIHAEAGEIDAQYMEVENAE